MSLKWSLGAKGLLVLAIPFAVQILLLLVLSTLQLRAEHAAFKVEGALHMSQLLSALLQDFVDIRVNAARYRIDYLVSEQFFETRKHCMDQLHELRELLKEEPESVQTIVSVEKHANEAVALMGNDKALDEWHQLEALDMVANQIQDDSLTLTELMEKKETLVATMTKELKHQGALYQMTLYGGSIIQATLLVLAVFIFWHDITQRIATIQKNSVLLAIRKPLGRRLKGSDELSQLDHVFHKMAGELEEASQIETVLTENVRAVFCTLDSKLTFKTSNSSSLAVFGYSPEELIGMRLAHMLPPEELTGLPAQVEKSRLKTVPPFEARVAKKDGTHIDTLWSITWSQPNSAFVCVVHDNSARKEAERMRERLLKMVTDDLKRPLSSVSNFLKKLRNNHYGELVGRGQELASTADGATLQMLTLINDLLDIEQLEAGTLRVNCDTLSLASLFAEVLQSTAAIARRAGVELECNANDLVVFADRHRMMQVLTNLISNAVKFSPKGSKISLEAIDINGCVELKVTDRGRGIPPDAVPHIFDRFRQTERSDATVKKGVGLGLSITKALVELQKGHIEVESVFGEGTTFTITLPKARSAREEGLSC